MTSSLPNGFLDKCSASERTQVERWWDTLKDNNRDDVRVLLDRRHDSLAYVYASDEHGNVDWHTIPFVDDELPIEDADDYENEWKLDYFHHLLDQPGFTLAQDVVVRTFHICSLHLSAINAHRNGIIDSSFNCSDGNPDCPIVRFMTDFDSARLIGYTSKSRRSVWLCKRKGRTEPSDRDRGRIAADPSYTT
ncbi:hypothetical protein [Roseimaritima ulvae]|uniref:Uncharacterized protein n=2 Tax=Pirellulaceae TaxID=2691357 RepID=A0A5B9R4N3_9BACT|nr:hypothetical protein [Roseimaritima ulvae]QEG41431.1 hypothetical protein UC8_34520 [Roseimaritima ulvae]